MMSAKVGDDVFGEDETINELEQKSSQNFRYGGGNILPVGHYDQPDRY